MGIKVKFDTVYKILPVITIYTDRFLPDRFSGYNFGFINLIRPSSANDVGLYEHEKQHSRQFYRTFGIGALLYRFSKKARLKYEVECYAVQILTYKRLSPTINEEYYLKKFARFISTRYNVNISEEKAYCMLKEKYEDLKKEVGA